MQKDATFKNEKKIVKKTSHYCQYVRKLRLLQRCSRTEVDKNVSLLPVCTEAKVVTAMFKGREVDKNFTLLPVCTEAKVVTAMFRG
jgi:hypothetical protein